MKYQIKANTKLEQFELESRLTWQDENSLPIWLEQFSMFASGLRQLSQKCDGEGSADWLQRAPCNCMPKVNNCVGFGKSKYGKSKQYPGNATVKCVYLIYVVSCNRTAPFHAQISRDRKIKITFNGCWMYSFKGFSKSNEEWTIKTKRLT